MDNVRSLLEKLKVIIFLPLLFIILFTLMANAQETYHITYTLKEAEMERDISNVTLQIREVNLNTNKNLTITEYITTNVIDLYLTGGEYEITLIIDDDQTEGKDYYAFEKIEVAADKNDTIYFFPVASIRGTVVDRLENILNDAEIKLSCDKDFIPQEQIITDKYGNFMITAVPTGNCIITASHKDSFEQQHLAFNKGDLETIRLKLEDAVQPGSSEFSLALFGIIVLLAVIGAGIAYWFFIYHKEELPAQEIPKEIQITQRLQSRRKKRTNKKPSTQSALPLRVEHILPTLRERERVVVQFLLANNGISTQARIRHGTKIPKTSLMRILETLKTKNIVAIDVTDIAKTVKLTAWFLEK